MVKLGRGKFLTMKKPRQSKFKKLMYKLDKEDQEIVNKKLKREWQKGWDDSEEYGFARKK